MAQNGSAGRAGIATRIGSDWIGWSGLPAHPNSPMGSGGPGNFVLSRGAALTIDDQQSPEQHGPMSGNDDGAIPAEQPKPANAPPATNPRTLTTEKKVKNDHVDVDIKAKVLADATGGPANGAHTDFNWPASSAPAYEAEDGKITKFKAKLTWKGVIKIQTKYGTGATATTLSCYGRGTTTNDVKNRDITLGFHENCHQNDFAAYLASHDLPEPPEMKIGMESTVYDTESKKFTDAVKAYKVAMKADSDSKTDGCGRKLSEVAAKGCYMHELPAEE